MNKYRSKLEQRIAQDLESKQIKFNFEPDWGKIRYTVPAKQRIYTPDFYIKTLSGKNIIIEAKGLWIFEDRYKHLLIKQSRPDLDIRFVFDSSKKKIRKGSTTTYADICEGRGHGFFKEQTWLYADRQIPEEWLNE